MTPPRTPSHESDQIVDMTPEFAIEEDSTEIVDMTPAYVPEDEAEEGDADAATSWSAPFPDTHPAMDRVHVHAPPQMPARIPARTPPRMVPAESGVVRAGPPAPAGPSVPPAGSATPPPSTPGGNRWKRILMVVAALLAVAFVGRTLGQMLSQRGGGNASQSTSATATSTPTPQTAQIGNQTVVTTPGPLILLNPGVVRQGTSVGVTGSGFDPGAVIDLTLKHQGSTTALASSFVQADKGGNFANAAVGVPMSLAAGNFVVEAKERNSNYDAQAVGTIAGGAPQVKLGIQVGKPGDVVVYSLHGFAPGEPVKVYWNSMSGQPVTTVKADGGGSIGQAKMQVPFGAVGDNTFLFVGATSQSMVAANFLVLQLYPTVKLGSYALKADYVMSFSGSGFGPGERVFVFLNKVMGQPLAVINTDANGAFKNAPGFVVPFQIQGKQTLIFMGEQSRAPDAVSFNVLPYSPVVQPSTYGGFPGTTISFYASGFARDEVVHVFAGHTKNTMGTMVACFQTDGKGSAAAVGSYMIPGDAQGQVGFALVGAKSGGVGVASVNISAPPAPVHTPPQAKFTCPLDPPPGQQNPAQQGQGQQLPPQQPPADQPPNQQQQPNQQQPGGQGRVTQPGQQIAAQPASYATSTAATSSALVLLALATSASPSSVSSQQAPALQTHGGTLDRASARSGARGSTVSQLRTSSFGFGLALAWLAIVLMLNITLIWRTVRNKAADTEEECADGEVAAAVSHSPALVAAASVQSSQDEQFIAAPPEAPTDNTTSLLEAQWPPLPVAVHHEPPAEVSVDAPPVGCRSGDPIPGPLIRAARATVTWHDNGRQPGHDVTFVQTGVRSASEQMTCSLFLVADGRCRGRATVTASQFAVEHIARRVITVMSSGTGIAPNLIRPLFKYAVMQAGDALLARNAAQRTDETTTVTGALVVGERAYVVNVGNSRTYMFSHNGGLWQITKDHSVVSGMVAAGLVSAAAIDASPRAQQLYRSLGDADQPIRVDTFALSILPGDQILLCSDGLWRRVRDAEIESILARNADPREATWELVRAASDSGADDDISAIVVHVLSDD